MKGHGPRRCAPCDARGADDRKWNRDGPRRDGRNEGVGGGAGPEHALCWALAQSPRVARVYCAPGNGGIARWPPACRLRKPIWLRLAQFARDAGIGLTVVGPEAPLAAG
ncbi:phosphoribosylamine--glycine ligase N-terminal domain-containing protein, partial [Calditerricola satsumensis]|uniref:phosphoribosylamine--glycine ligase N-terminal domain-containing protein n=1 Tax=Calditerricola satsumensis TaxID=373054 RepID=UPI00357170AB